MVYSAAVSSPLRHDIVELCKLVVRRLTVRFVLLDKLKDSVAMSSPDRVNRGSSGNTLPGSRPCSLFSALRKNQFVTSTIWSSSLSSLQKKFNSIESFAKFAIVVPGSGIARSSTIQSPVVKTIHIIVLYLTPLYVKNLCVIAERPWQPAIQLAMWMLIVNWMGI